MSSCKGGISSNSTLSWMGLYFQTEKQKQKQKYKNIQQQKHEDNKDYIFMPYPWINYSEGHNEDNTRDIYPHWVQLYDTIHNKIIE